MLPPLRNPMKDHLDQAIAIALHEPWIEGKPTTSEEDALRKALRQKISGSFDEKDLQDALIFLSAKLGLDPPAKTANELFAALPPPDPNRTWAADLSFDDIHESLRIRQEGIAIAFSTGADPRLTRVYMQLDFLLSLHNSELQALSPEQQAMFSDALETEVSAFARQFIRDLRRAN